MFALLLSLPVAGCASTVADRQLLEAKGDGAARKQDVPRRAMPMVIERPSPAAPSAPRTTAPSIPQTTVPPGPSPVTSCDAGGCWSGGQRYQGGAGGTYLDRSGRLCQSNGTWMQCY
ncbi:MAG TPA: hypothetical protein VEC35_01955 [Noviherbaspirillum sp.]|nr:hypothetical protein [Noviherbaspirillum sp.]